MFKDVLRSLRTERGISQTQLAEAVGVSPGNLGDWERGKSKPGYDALARLSRALDVPLEELVIIDEDGSSPPMKREVPVADPAQDVGERIMQQLRQQGLTQADLCRITGLSTTAVSQYCTGKRTPDTTSLFALARALGTTMEWLLAGEEGGPKPERPITIGSRIRSRRQSLGLTLKDIADREGLHTGNLSELENDKYLPSVPALIALSRALDVSVDWLLGLSRDDPDPALTPDEEQLLTTCRTLPPAARLDVLDYALFKLRRRPESPKSGSSDSR